MGPLGGMALGKGEMGPPFFVVVAGRVVALVKMSFQYDSKGSTLNSVDDQKQSSHERWLIGSVLDNAMDTTSTDLDAIDALPLEEPDNDRVHLPILDGGNAPFTFDQFVDNERQAEDISTTYRHLSGSPTFGHSFPLATSEASEPNGRFMYPSTGNPVGYPAISPQLGYEYVLPGGLYIQGYLTPQYQNYLTSGGVSVPNHLLLAPGLVNPLSVANLLANSGCVLSSTSSTSITRPNPCPTPKSYLGAALTPNDVDRLNRLAMADSMESTCTWSGIIPGKDPQNAGTYSCKVFVGGVPFEITEGQLVEEFGKFGPIRVEWPGKEARYAASAPRNLPRGKGYVYIIYEKEKLVKALLQSCTRETSQSGEWYMELPNRTSRAVEYRQVQIIPWNIGDSNYFRCPSQRLDPKKTIFVGALHGLITAEVLGTVMNDLFGGVVYAGLDLDKYKYPIGSGRVTFGNTRSYFKALNAAYVEIKSAKFSKKVQIDPFLEESACSHCSKAQGIYFCREPMCFRYFCGSCWVGQHQLDVMQWHRPLMRNNHTRRSSQCSDTSGVTTAHPYPGQYP